MKRLSFVASVVTVVGYLSLALLAWTRFPNAYGPASNWLSDLGSGAANPAGASFYNAGIVLAGVCTLLFFLGLSVWKMAGNRKQLAMLYLTQTFGSLGALAMVLSALFPIHTGDAHAFWSAALFILLGTGFAFSVAAFRYHAAYPRWLLFVGVAVTIEDFVWSVALNIPVVEWITVGLFLLYVLLVGIETRRRAEPA